MSRSKLQEDVGKLLKSIFPYNSIKEEYHIGQGLMLDFLIIRSHGINFGIEVQGQQHYQPNSFFHKDEEGWVMQQRNDAKKKVLCAQQNIVLVEFKYDDALTRQVLFDKISKALDTFQYDNTEPPDPYENINKIANAIRRDQAKKARLKFKKNKKGGQNESN